MYYHKTFGSWSLVWTFLNTHATYPTSVEIGFRVVVICSCCDVNPGLVVVDYLLLVFINLHHCEDFHPFWTICILHLHFLWCRNLEVRSGMSWFCMSICANRCGPFLGSWCQVQGQPLVWGSKECLPLGLSSRGSSSCAGSPGCSHQCVCSTACCLVLLQLSQFLLINMGMGRLGSVSGQILQFLVPKMNDCVHCSIFHFSCVFSPSLFPYTGWFHPTICDFGICPRGLEDGPLSCSCTTSLPETCSGLWQGCFGESIGIWLHDHGIGGYSYECCPLVFI